MRYRGGTRLISLVVMMLAAGVATAAAKPALEPHAFGAFAIQTPKGWAFTTDAAKNTAIAQQDATRKDAAQIVIIVIPTNAPDEDKLLDASIGQAAPNLKVVKRGSISGGAKALVVEGVVDGIKVRMGGVAVVSNGAGILGILATKVDEFDGMGGTDLVFSVIASLKQVGGASAPEPAPAPAPSSGGVPAGRYACQQMRYTVNSPPTYVPTGISFELDGRGGYNAPSFKGGPGRVSFSGNVMTFSGGSMNGWRGYTGSISSGPFVRIRMKDPTAVADKLLLGDAMCYLQR